MKGKINMEKINDKKYSYDLSALFENKRIKI